MFWLKVAVSSQHTLQFWLGEGVAGFSICDTDAGYSEKVKCCSVICTLRDNPQIYSSKIILFQTLLGWRGVFKNFDSQEDQRYRSEG